MPGYIIISVKKPAKPKIGLPNPLASLNKNRNNSILVSLDGQEFTLEADGSYKVEIAPGEHELLAQDNDLLEKTRGKTIAKAVGAFAFGSLTSGSFYGIKDGLDSMSESLEKSNAKLSGQDAWSVIKLFVREGETVNVTCEMTTGGKVKVILG